jgi:hypothetical protein
MAQLRRAAQGGGCNVDPAPFFKLEASSTLNEDGLKTRCIKMRYIEER